jgi:hypothetical protein
MRVERRSAVQPFSEFAECLPCLEPEPVQPREGEAALRGMTAQIAGTAQTARIFGSALLGFAHAMRGPLKRGRAGGPPPARQVRCFGKRWPSNGRFMADSDWVDIEREGAEEDYMRYASGGFAR